MRVELAERPPQLCARISGTIDGDADFAPLLQSPSAELTLDLSAVRMITSAGVVSWLRFVKSLSADRIVRLQGCPVSFVNQLSLIADCLGTASVESLYVPYLCLSCNFAENVLTRVTDLDAGAAAPRTCSRCGGQMEADVLEEQYFAFLRS